MVKYFIMAKYVDIRSYKTDIIWLPWPHSSNVRFKYTSAHHIDNMLIFLYISIKENLLIPDSGFPGSPPKLEGLGQ